METTPPWSVLACIDDMLAAEPDTQSGNAIYKTLAQMMLHVAAEGTNTGMYAKLACQMAGS